MRMIVPVPARSISRWIVTATATGGTPGGTGVAGMQGTANATSSVVTDRGALAQAQCTAVWFKRTSPIDRTNKPWSRPIDCISSCRKHGDHERNRSSLRVRPILCEPLTDSIRLLDRISGQVYARRGPPHVADALLGARDQIFGAAIAGGNYAPEGAVRATRTAVRRPSTSTLTAIC